MDGDEEKMKEWWLKDGFRWRGKIRERAKRRSGGIACITKLDMEVEYEEEKKDDYDEIMWVHIKEGVMKMHVGIVYQVPASSTWGKRHVDSNEFMQRLECDIWRYKVSGDAVMVVGDMNAHIANSSQILQQKIGKDEYKDAEEEVITRESEDERICTYGRRLIEMCNATRMVIGNGVSMKNTRARVTKRVEKKDEKASVVDYIIYDEAMRKAVSAVEVDTTDIHSDHYLVFVDIDMKELSKRFGKKDSTMRSRLVSVLSPCTSSVSLCYPQHHEIERQERVCFRMKQENHEDWKNACEIEMKKWLSEYEDEVDTEEMWRSWRDVIFGLGDRMLETRRKSTGRQTRMKKHKIRLEKPSERLMELIIKRRQAHDNRDWEEYRIIAKKIKRKVRREKMKEIENEQEKIQSERSKNPRMYWMFLYKAIRWITNHNNAQTSSSETDIERFKTSFERLGNDDGSSGSIEFDKTFEKCITYKLNEILAMEEEARKREKEIKLKLEAEEMLNKPIELNEVMSVARELPNNKAAGVDSITNEMVKYGGVTMYMAMWKLCEHVYEYEHFPDDWSKGIICPIYKEGDKADPLNYRGITLLSIVSKLFVAIINNRLKKWCEMNDVIVDEQAGFREHRSCTDQLFALAEIARMRKAKGLNTFCAFVDIKKAYDRVYRSGLWVCLWNAGVRGKMFRTIKKMYERVESAVAMNGMQSDFFEVNVGLRQGCILSPLLFLIFINTLAIEINQKNLGTTIHDRNVSLLLFADDIVLIAETPAHLQQQLKCVYEFCEKWKTEVNAKKTEVMVFGSKRTIKKEQEWWFGDVKLKTVDKYKYLGLDFCSNLRWKQTKERLFTRARAKESAAFNMANASEILTIEFGIDIWQTLIRPILEYGCEVWSDDMDWVEAERLQLFVARRILRCTATTTNEAVLGELGWWTMRARRDMIRLNYWGKLVNMEDSRVTKLVYRTSKKRFDELMKNRLRECNIQIHELEEREADERTQEEERQLRALRREVSKMKVESWCAATYAILMRYEMDDHWDNEWLEVDWKRKVKKAVRAREQEEWRKRMSKKPKLRTYQMVKTELKMEDYLKQNKLIDRERMCCGLRRGGMKESKRVNDNVCAA
jgi:hypothetical protein